MRTLTVSSSRIESFEFRSDLFEDGSPQPQGKLYLDLFSVDTRYISVAVQHGPKRLRWGGTANNTSPQPLIEDSAARIYRMRARIAPAPPNTIV